ncbi:FliO/MopB family protein [Rhodanobacter ginsengisoli]|uniref:FliO/MopB family protein n=1 Tax=Rhodanobacter ginsengisoli TaxID=418646 RepID=A0ABW0QJC8_9GAMM
MLALIAAAPSIAAPDINVGGELLRVILSLVGIIVLILAAGWLSRRLRVSSGAGGRRIRCVETFAVGTRDRLLLINADGQRLLIGVGQGGMRTLHVYDGSEPAALEAMSPASPVPGFAELLARWRRTP